VRVIPVHGTTPRECVTDGKSAVRWLRSFAGRQGVPKDRIVAAGGSAAGHVSLCAAMLPGLEEPADDPGDDLSISSVPNLVCTYNPAVLPYIDPAGSHDEQQQVRVDRFGSAESVWELSPTRLIRAGLPPMIIMQGDEDTVTPLGPCQAFADGMAAAGNECQLVVYPGAGHGFLNYSPEGNPWFEDTLREVDRFLNRHGFLRGEPTV
jgi:acetyl esterase/lipase